MGSETILLLVISSKDRPLQRVGRASGVGKNLAEIRERFHRMNCKGSAREQYTLGHMFV